MFEFPAEVVEAFTDGDCALLAVALHDLTGYPLVTASSELDDRQWYHAGVLLPSGGVLDIRGVSSVTVWLEFWAKDWGY